MKTKVEVLESGATKLTVTIEATDIDTRIKRTYRDFGKKYKFPGFRPGHVPRPVIDSHLGKDAVRGQVTDELLNESLPLAIDQCDLNPISQVRLADVDGFVEEGKDFVFSAEFEVKPEFELSDYSPVRVEIPFRNATEAEIDEQVEILTDYYVDYEDAHADAEVTADGAVDLALSAKDYEGKDISALSTESRFYALGRGLFPAAFDEALIGLKKGESASVTVDIAAQTSIATSMLKRRSADEDASQDITLDATVLSVKKKIVPEVTDEWVKEKLRVDSVEKLREQLAVSIEQQKADAISRIRENNALYELQKRLEGEPPASMEESTESDLLRTFFEQLQRSGITLDAYLEQQGITSDQFKKDVKAQASDTVRQNLALDAWARHNNITVTDEEVVKEFESIDAKNSDTLYADWKSQGRLHIVREGILRRKALEVLLRDADVVEVEKPSLTNEDGAQEAEAEETKTDGAGAEAAEPQEAATDGVATDGSGEASSEEAKEVNSEEAEEAKTEVKTSEVSSENDAETPVGPTEAPVEPAETPVEPTEASAETLAPEKTPAGSE